MKLIPTRAIPARSMVAATLVLMALALSPRAGEADGLLAPLETPVDLGHVWTLTFETFPEAYRDLSAVTMREFGGRLVPESVEMYVPVRFLQTELTEDVILGRLTAIVGQMLPGEATCVSATIDEPFEHPFLAWDDHMVSLVTLYFGIGC